MGDPEPREREGSAEAEGSPTAGREDHAVPAGENPAPGLGEKLGLNLGNPLESESAAFGWLIVVLVAAITVGAVAKLISPLAAVIWLIILLGAVSVPLFKGLRHQLGSPDDDE